jgi:hypothetical protein
VIGADCVNLVHVIRSVLNAEQLAILKADTFRESFAAGNDPAELAAHIERAFSVDVVAAQLVDPDCDTTWILDGNEPVGYRARGTAARPGGRDRAA